ncbi:MAG: radical SAM protein [Clostridiales bacterium]|jgi:uncharacterized protein|nr:radical SAM protein [Clostridiales bacterium]
MHFTLHLTQECNLRCRYCYVRQGRAEMSLETAKKIVDLAGETAKKAGIIFFGGEPLLKRQLIADTVIYAREASKQNGCKYFFKITTNGLLLDDAFLEFAEKESVFIALSVDGTQKAHDSHRIDASGHGTYEQVCKAAKKLLAVKPYAPCLMTVNPDTLCDYAKSVEAMFQLGFSYVICSLNYAADWTKADMRTLKHQYEALSDLYYRKTKAEDKFYFSPFEVKISSHINNKTYCHERCELGLKQLSVSPDGKLYPCVQFVGDDNFCVGNISDGIDQLARERLYRLNEKEKPGCENCAIKTRCNHYCGCLNRQATGSIGEVSPVLCAHERIVLPIADKLAARLYKERSGLFIQKHYNEFYPLVSLAEDKAARFRT